MGKTLQACMSRISGHHQGRALPLFVEGMTLYSTYCCQISQATPTRRQAGPFGDNRRDNNDPVIALTLSTPVTVGHPAFHTSVAVRLVTVIVQLLNSATLRSTRIRGASIFLQNKTLPYVYSSAVEMSFFDEFLDASIPAWTKTFHPACMHGVVRWTVNFVNTGGDSIVSPRNGYGFPTSSSHKQNGQLHRSSDHSSQTAATAVHISAR